MLGAAAMPRLARAAQVPEFWHYMGAGGEYDGVKAMIAEVNKINPSDPIAERVIPGHAPGLRQQIQVSLMGGEPPVVYQLDTGYELTQVGKAGRLLEIDDVWKDIDGDRIFPEGLRRVVSFDGRHAAVPIASSVVNHVFYNKAVFDKLSLTPPKSWEEWDDVCAKLKGAGIAPLANASGGPWSFYNFYPQVLQTMGVDGYWKFARGEVPYTSPELKRALELYGKHFAENYAPNWTGAKWSDGADLLMKGTVGMYLVGDWASGYMKGRGFKPGVDYDFFSAPGTETTSIFQADSVAALKGDKPDLARKVLKAVATASAQAAFNAPKGSLAPNKDAPTDIYDPIQKRESDEMNATGATVLPNLLILMPVDYRTTLRNEVERYASSPTPAALQTLLDKMEPLRQATEKQGAFYKW